MIVHPNWSPELISFGPLAVRWYGLMYVLGYVVGYQLLLRRIRQGTFQISPQALESFIVHLIVGMLIGARLVYSLVYNWDYYSMRPLEVLYLWKGGLSFHGAALGMSVGAAIFSWRQRVSVLSSLDALAYACGPGLFFGRIGNFINQELYGRATDVPWGVLFQSDPSGVPRHPSQLYQGLTEGLLLFGLLHLVESRSLRSGRYRPGQLGGFFLVGYGVLRFCMEFFREPDAQLGFVWLQFSMGQLLCVGMVLVGVVLLVQVSKLKPVPIDASTAQR